MQVEINRGAPASSVPSTTGRFAPDERVRRMLAPNESILWAAQPKPYVFMLRGLPNIAYGVTWSVLGAFWFRGALVADWQGWWRIVPWLSIPFILAGFSFWFYPLRLGGLARRTWYVITNQRVLALERRKDDSPMLRLFSPTELAAMYILKRPGGLRDLIFVPGGQDNPQLQPRLESGFFGVERGDEAAALIRLRHRGVSIP